MSAFPINVANSYDNDPQQSFLHESVYQVLNNSILKNKKVCLAKFALGNNFKHQEQFEDNLKFNTKINHEERFQSPQRTRGSRTVHGQKRGSLQLRSRSPSPFKNFRSITKEEALEQQLNFSLKSKNSPLILSPLVLTPRAKKRNAKIIEVDMSSQRKKELEKTQNKEFVTHDENFSLKNQILVERINEEALQDNLKLMKGVSTQASNLKRDSIPKSTHEKCRMPKQLIHHQDLSMESQQKTLSVGNSFSNCQTKNAADQIINNYYTNYQHLDIKTSTIDEYINSQSENALVAKKNFTHKYNQHKNNKELQRLLDMSYTSVSNSNSTKNNAQKNSNNREDAQDIKYNDYHGLVPINRQANQHKQELVCESVIIKQTESSYKIPQLFKQQKEYMKQHNSPQKSYYPDGQESLLSMTNSSFSPNVHKMELQVIIDQKRSPINHSPIQRKSRSPQMIKQKRNSHEGPNIHVQITSVSNKSNSQLKHKEISEFGFEKEEPEQKIINPDKQEERIRNSGAFSKSALQSYRKPTFQNMITDSKNNQSNHLPFSLERTENQSQQSKQARKLPLSFVKQQAKLKDLKLIIQEKLESLEEKTPQNNNSVIEHPINHQNQMPSHPIRIQDNQSKETIRQKTHNTNRNSDRLVKSHQNQSRYQKLNTLGYNQRFNPQVPVRKSREHEYQNFSGQVIQQKDFCFPEDLQYQPAKQGHLYRINAKRREISHLISNDNYKDLDLKQYISQVKFQQNSKVHQFYERISKAQSMFGKNRRKNFNSVKQDHQKNKSHLVISKEDMMQPSVESRLTQYQK